MARRFPRSLHRAAAVRELDRVAIEEHGLPGAELMERAGRAAFEALRRTWPDAPRVTVLCGGGNNAGDGFVLARLAAAAGLETRVAEVGDPDKLRGDALAAYERLREAGVASMAWGPEVLGEPGVVVDALLGTGLDRDVAGSYREAIERANGLAGARLALDIPSGLHADTGRVLGAAFRADVTVTFIGLKRGLFTGAGRGCCGRVEFDDLGVPAAVHEAVPADACRIGLDSERGSLGSRSRTAHKGAFGHVLVVGGDAGFAGAPRLAAEAAARCGAGLVSVATRAAHAPGVALHRPELMGHGVEHESSLAPLLDRAGVVALGPGLGRADWGRRMLGAALAAGLPAVVDADALNLLAEGAVAVGDGARVYTPHPGEAGRLLASSARDVESDRFAAAEALAERHGGVWVLKGAGTIVAGDGLPAVCDGGNPGMASGGMGDVLTGVIAALLAQGLAPGEAARLGTCLHAAAGDAAAEEGGERGLLAGDLTVHLRRLVNTV